MGLYRGRRRAVPDRPGRALNGLRVRAAMGTLIPVRQGADRLGAGRTGQQRLLALAAGLGGHPPRHCHVLTRLNAQQSATRAGRSIGCAVTLTFQRQ